MDRIEIGIIGVVAALVLIGLRMPIGVALGAVSFLGIVSLIGLEAAWGMLTSIPLNFVANWNLSAVPMFLLMGYIAARAGLTNGLFTSARILFGRVPGSLASSTVMASALFASCSGSSMATAAAFAKISVPEMLKAGYRPSLATGLRGLGRHAGLADPAQHPDDRLRDLHQHLDLRYLHGRRTAGPALCGDVHPDDHGACDARPHAGAAD